MSYYQGWFVEFEYVQQKTSTGKFKEVKRCSANKMHGVFTKNNHKFCPTCGSPLEMKKEEIFNQGKPFGEHVAELNCTGLWSVDGTRVRMMLPDHEWIDLDNCAISEIVIPEKPHDVTQTFKDIQYTPDTYELKYGIMLDYY